MVTPPTSKRGRARRWLLNYPRAIPLAIFAAIAAITALSVYSIESNVRQREAAQMREYAQTIASALERRGNSFSSYLRAGAALFSSVDEVSPQTFRQFVSELRLDVEYKGAEGIGWASVVPRAGEAEGRAEETVQALSLGGLDMLYARYTGSGLSPYAGAWSWTY